MPDSPLPPLRLLTVFDAVLRSGGLQQAASALNVTQPAISQALKALEDHVGARLLDRTTRPATPTEAGRVLQAAVTEGFGLIGEAIERARALDGGANNSVTVACSVGFATYWLMPKLAEFYNEHPDVAVNVLTTPQGAPALSVGVDLAIRYGAGDWRDGSVTKLFDERVDPVCSPALAARLGPHGLETAVLLHVRANEATWLGWKDYLERFRLRESRAPGRSFSNYVQATQAALAGHGVMLGWKSITGALVREGRLVSLLDQPITPQEAFHLVRSNRRERQSARETLATWLERAANADESR